MAPFRHPTVALIARLFLGIVFIYAAYHKIEYPPGFAKEIVPYRLMPTALVNLMAIYLPWVEMVCGIALVLGVWKRTAGLLTMAMLVVFLVAIGSRFLRGEWDFECGCFPASDSPIDAIPVLGHAKKFFFSSPNAIVTFFRDVFLLVLSWITVASSPPERGAPR